MASLYKAGNAEVYERLMGRWSRRLAPPFIQFAAPGNADTLIDVGCGTGSLTFALAEAFPQAHVLGVDASSAFLDYARARAAAPRLSFREADATALPFAQGQFSAALSLLVLNFIPDYRSAAQEMRRVTMPGGVVAAAVWDFAGGFTHLRMLLDTAALLDPAGDALRTKLFAAPLTGPQELAALWSEIGLRDVTFSSLAIRMDFETFMDFWAPFLGGEGSIGPYVAGLDKDMRANLEHHLRRAYLSGREDGARSFVASAWVVRGIR